MAKKNESKDPTVDTAVYAFVVTLFVAIGVGVWCNSLGLAVFIVIGGIYEKILGVKFVVNVWFLHLCRS